MQVQASSGLASQWSAYLNQGTRGTRVMPGGIDVSFVGVASGRGR